jgi:hypothetical protein
LRKTPKPKRQEPRTRTRTMQPQQPQPPTASGIPAQRPQPRGSRGPPGVGSGPFGCAINYLYFTGPRHAGWTAAPRSSLLALRSSAPAYTACCNCTYSAISACWPTCCQMAKRWEP